MNKVRRVMVAAMTLMILVVGSGLAQALPSPKWLPLRPNW